MELINKVYPLGFFNYFIPVIKLALPIALCYELHVVLTLSTVFFCGQIGEEELAAVALGNLLFNICCYTVMVGFSTGLDTLLPQIFGSGNKKKVGVILQKSLVISLITSFMSAVVLLNTKHLLVYIIEEPRIIRLADGYMKLFIPVIFLLNLDIHLIKYLQIQDIITPVTVINLIGAIISIILQYLFVIRWNLGINGSAVAVNITFAIIVILIFSYIRVKKIYVDTWSEWSLECFSDWNCYLKLAIPGFFMIALEWISWEIAILCSGTLGTISLDSISIVQTVMVYASQISIALAVSGNIYAGQFLGANKPKEAINALKVIFTITIFVTLLILLLIYSTSNYLPYVFGDNPDLIRLASGLLKVGAFVNFFNGITLVLAGFLRAIGKQNIGSIIVVIAYYVFALPIGLSLMLKTSIGVYGWYCGVTIGIIVSIICQLFIIYRVDWFEYAQKAHEKAKSKISTEIKIEIIDQNEYDKRDINIVLFKKFFIYAVVIGLFFASLYFNATSEISNEFVNRTNVTE